MAEATVYIVDDDEAIRDSLAWLFKSRGYRVQAYASGQAFLDAGPLVEHGCLVLDVRMPGMTGLELHERLAASGVALPVMFLTGHGDIPMAVGALRRGAVDFVEKPFNDNELVDKVEACLALDAARREAQARHGDLDRRVAQLTPREVEVMRLILAGRMNKTIADALHISMRTVEVHRARVLEKMGVRSAVELAGLVPRSAALRACLEAPPEGSV